MPPPTPSSLSQLLTTLRAPIFKTLPVVNNTRTGTKYLRRRLRGPSVLAYVPHLPKLQTLNAFVPWNKYAGWQGDRGVTHQLPKDSVVEDGFEQVTRKDKAGPPKKYSPSNNAAAAAFSAAKRTDLGEAAVWVDSAKERVRFEDVARKKRIGKGPPKKGQGRRSQMKKR